MSPVENGVIGAVPSIGELGAPGPSGLAPELVGASGPGVLDASGGTALDTVGAGTSGAAGGEHSGLPDLPLGQLPDNVAPFAPPAFVLSRKEIETAGSPLTGGLPHGLGGANGPDSSASSALAGVLTPGIDAAHGVLSGAQHTLADAQGALSGTQAAVNGIPAALDAAQAALSNAAVTLPVLPPLPADPVGDLMKGLALPAIPGIDALFKPFLDLINAFGTGVLGQLNPATLLSQGSQLIETALQVGKGAVETVESAWQGKASGGAQDASQQAQAHGRETTQRGFDLSAVTEQAAAVVQRGNVQLTAIAQSFAAQATALAPVILAPPAQTALIASATEHLASAVTVVNVTRGELAGYTAQVNAVVGQLLGQNAGPNPAEVAKSLAQNVGQPILEQAKQLIEGGLNAANAVAAAPGPGSPTDPDTKAAGLGAGAAVGGGGGLGGGGLGGGGGTPSAPGGPGSSVPGGRLAPAAPGPFGAGGPGVPGMTGPLTPGFMGSPAAAAAGRGADQDHARAVQPYQSPTGDSELTADLGPAIPRVIGEPDNPAEEDQPTQA
ncbi:hypothetical protein ACWDOP_10680 [Nocardia sp. NPDC003693]